MDKPDGFIEVTVVWDGSEKLAVQRRQIIALRYIASIAEAPEIGEISSQEVGALITLWAPPSSEPWVFSTADDDSASPHGVRVSETYGFIKILIEHALSDPGTIWSTAKVIQRATTLQTSIKAMKSIVFE